jgi:hypothetical protein
MDVESFWKLIAKSREAANGDARKQSDLLTEELAKLSAEEIVSFQTIFYDLKDKAYIGNLWDAATVMMDGCSDSGFEEFREWLVGRGKLAYENALKYPETLVDVLEASEVIFPTLLGPAMDAYEKITGKDMPPNPREWTELQGKPTINLDKEETELLAEISARFPKLTAKFWEWWKRDKIYIDIRAMLRELLVPLEFSESDRGFLVVLKYQRTPFAVEITLDIDINESAYWFVLYASSELSEKGYPIRQSVTEFYYHEYNEEKKRSIRASIQEWIASVGLK